ncbi:MAG TPA: AI-2E family transporter [Candidatus Methylacidiphilales bacterium]
MTHRSGPTPEQERLLWKALSLLAVLFLAAVGLGAGWLLLTAARHLQDILIPLGVAAVLAYLLSPLIGLLERAGLRRALAVPILFALAGAALVLAVWLLGPKLWREASTLAHYLPGWIDTLKDKADHFLDSGSDAAAPSKMAPFVDAAKNHAEGFAGKLVQTSVAGVGSLLKLAGLFLGLFFVPFYLFYFLRDQPQIEKSWRTLIPLGNTRLRAEVVLILEQINGYLVSFFRGQVVVAAINGLLLALGLGLAGIESSLLIGVAAAFVTVIPYLGMGLVTLVTLLVAGFQDGGGLHLCLLAAAVIAATQLIEGTLISPRVMGEKTGLSPVAVVLSILFWSTVLGGLLGAILAVPLTATLKVLLVRYALVPPSEDSEEPKGPAISPSP